MIAQARAWTTERGLGGFTVEELCEEVAISRRTFFNYFATKEDAVLGVPARTGRDAEDRFLAARGSASAGELSTDLLSDLAELLIDRHERLGLGAYDLATLIAAIEREPRLLTRALTLTRQQEISDTALVEQREQLRPGDLRASLLVHLLGTVLRGAFEEMLNGDGQESLRAVFERRLSVARFVFAA